MPNLSTRQASGRAGGASRGCPRGWERGAPPGKTKCSDVWIWSQRWQMCAVGDRTVAPTWERRAA
eukprot:11047293-Alexandrium_andersonii.AAC.1